ncbi:unnamed protein product [Rhizoctonia solani]|uniref:Uncharacterized protein n=1 Tax=Rhizoctonia solani TaxID=456999 RepID=A0A8H3E016_9AGAM|nr:unnamed protein product [Rhizoctonia solani]
MVTFVRFLTSALTLATFSLALPASNATLSILDRADLVCGADRPPRAGLPKADEARLASSFVQAPPATRAIDVYWNVIYKNTTYSGGYLSSAQVNSAISALNSQFVGSGFTFKRASLKYTKNTKWFDNLDNEGNNTLATAMKNKLHVGTAKDLNIYSVGFTNSQHFTPIFSRANRSDKESFSILLGQY